MNVSNAYSNLMGGMILWSSKEHGVTISAKFDASIRMAGAELLNLISLVALSGCVPGVSVSFPRWGYLASFALLVAANIFYAMRTPRIMKTLDAQASDGVSTENLRLAQRYVAGTIALFILSVVSLWSFGH